MYICRDVRQAQASRSPHQHLPITPRLLSALQKVWNPGLIALCCGLSVVWHFSSFWDMGNLHAPLWQLSPPNAFSRCSSGFPHRSWKFISRPPPPRLTNLAKGLLFCGQHSHGCLFCDCIVSLPCLVPLCPKPLVHLWRWFSPLSELVHSGSVAGPSGDGSWHFPLWGGHSFQIGGAMAAAHEVMPSFSC